MSQRAVYGLMVVACVACQAPRVVEQPSCEGWSATLVVRTHGAGLWRISCAENSPKLERLVFAAEGFYDALREGAPARPLSNQTWRAVWARIEASGWREQYDLCLEDNNLAYQLEVRTPTGGRRFHCERLPLAYAPLALAIQSAETEPGPAPARPALVRSQASVAGECTDGFAAIVTWASKHDAATTEVWCRDGVPRVKTTHVSSPPADHESRPRRMPHAAWQALWAALDRHQWRRLPDCSMSGTGVPPNRAPYDAVSLRLRDDVGSRDLGCDGSLHDMPEPYQSMAKAVFAAADREAP